MLFPVQLPRLSWGSIDAPHRALLVHGLGSNGALMWRFGEALAGRGWRADAVDLRGHGTAPRALTYTIDAFAADLAETRPSAGGAWDLVIAHSLGGAASVIVAAGNPDWTSQLVLIDPAIYLDEGDRAVIASGQEESFADPSPAAVRALHPHWHPLDVEEKVRATAQASRWAVEQTGLQNTPWDVRTSAVRLTIPTHVIAADPAVHTLFTGELAAEVLENPRITMSIVPGAGHSPHRDKPEETMSELFRRITP